MEEVLIQLSSQQGVTGSFFVGDDNSFVSQTLSKSFAKENAQRAVMVLAQTFDALNQVAQFQITKMMVNSRGIRLFIRRADKGYLNLLTDATADAAVIDAALDGALTEIKNLTAAPAAPAPVILAPPAPVPAAKQAAPVVQPKTAPITAAPAPPAPTPAVKAPAVPTQAIPVPVAKPAAPPAPPKPAPVPAAPLEPAVLDKILAVAEEFLGELGPDIFQNQMTDHKISKEKLLRDPVMKFCYGLQKDAAMIIGPSAAKQMADRMMLLLK
ncbi:hypothetical protein HY768_05140 [candidate division TA06 bacterium]|uniref:Roadblock/LAMTOR2 domain-containing protein n=1 Tax=candidate division TA06 bacterium TaxID=2250710 RepID=A0A933IC31_UNCT6|nr:hypothetical protein [candidate division TA06 bacterium]